MSKSLVSKGPEQDCSRLCIFGPCRYFLGRNRPQHRASLVQSEGTSPSLPSSMLASVHDVVSEKQATSCECREEEKIPQTPDSEFRKGKFSPTASTSTMAPSSPAMSPISHGVYSSDSFNLDQEIATEQVTIPIVPSLLFYGSKSSEDEQEEPPLLQAESLELTSSGEVRAIGALAGNGLAEIFPSILVYSSPQDLLVDVRVQHDDEPRLINIVGARVQKGGIDSIFIDMDSNSICCRIARYSNRDAEATSLSLEQAVQEMCELERVRRNAELAKYQKQLCSSMMRSQRARYLGLDQ